MTDVLYVPMILCFCASVFAARIAVVHHGLFDYTIIDAICGNKRALFKTALSLGILKCFLIGTMLLEWLIEVHSHGPLTIAVMAWVSALTMAPVSTVVTALAIHKELRDLGE